MNSIIMRYVVLVASIMLCDMYARDNANIRVEITIPAILANELKENQRLLVRDLDPFFRSYGLTFVTATELHITLVYIDSMPADKYADLELALQHAAQRIAPIDDIYIQSHPILLGQKIPFIVFPLKESKKLREAIDSITTSLRAKNIAVKKFINFRPHISLGYIAVHNTRNVVENIGSSRVFDYKGTQLKVGPAGLVPIIEKVCKEIPAHSDEISADTLVVSGARTLKYTLKKK